MTIEQRAWPRRLATVRGVPKPVEVGAHPDIKAIYGLDVRSPAPASFDLVAAAVGG